MKLLVVLMVVLAGMGVAFAQPSEIESVNEMWVSRFNSGDASGVAELYSDFGGISSMTGLSLFGPRGVEHFVITMREGGVTSVEMKVLTGDLGDGWGHYLVEFTFSDAEGQVLDWGHAEFMLERVEGVWKIGEHRHLGSFPLPGMGLGE